LDNSTIKKLLVPLDGSPMAESVLPITAQLARKILASVTLIHVVEKDPPETIHGQRHLTNSEQAENYLRTMASSSIFEGIEVSFHLHEAGVRDVSQSISDHTEELDQDLVVLCTHGSSGLRGILYGSIAQQVISFGNTPVLLINPSSGNFASKFENFLVPLDGNPDHEQSLTYASMLAKMCGAKIHLLIAIPQFGTMSGELTPTNRFLPGTTTKMMDMIVPDAEAYLSQLQKRIESGGLQVTTSTSRNKPGSAIPKTAKTINADLIILATHGKRGAEAFWSGSITPKISKSSKVPLLLVPVSET
jgi:nucleotide-binding universal stress UspA family protein